MSQNLPSIKVPSIHDPLTYRLSTPKNRSAAAIDPAYPTIAFIHPVWGDSFIFYPQFECPELYENYNLFCLDLPGHGTSHLSQKIDFTWTKGAIMLYEALVILNVPKVHLFGCHMGSNTVMRFTLDHPEMTLSTICVRPPIGTEPELVNIAFAEWLESLIPAITEKDVEWLTSLNQQAFDFVMGMRQDYPLTVLANEYKHLMNSRLHTGELDYALGVYLSLVMGRDEFPKTSEVVKVQTPVLILETVDASDATGPLVEDINEERMMQGLPPLAHRTLIEEDPSILWLPVTDPIPVNKTVVQFLATGAPPATTPPHPPVPGARLPAVPRDISGFEMPTEEEAAKAKKTSLVDIVKNMKGTRGIDFVWEVHVQIEVTNVTYEDF
ncbi:hypothetical protein IAT38_003555 [Cryptococcus sp. DSM 104549]